MARYRQGNYDFVIDSTFTPFTMQEMLVPFTAYKEEYDREEEAYTELSQKANDFEYLSKTLPEDSKARQVYEGYANDLKAQADDLTKNGLGMGNRRALLNMKRRYSGEIGRLVKADEALKKVQEMRMQKNAQDPSMLYTDDNLNIDMFLDNNNPNLYGISGNELYAKGAAAGRAASARIYSNPAVQKLDNYYNNYFNTVGYSPEKMQEFRDNLAAIPELQRAAMDIVQANKVGELGENSANYKAALQQIVNGIADGAIYERKDNMQRNLGVMTAAEKASNDLGWANHNETVRMNNLQLSMAGYDKNGVYHPENDQTLKKAAAIAAAKGGSAGGRGSSTMKDTQTSGRVRLTWNGDNPNDTNGDADDDYSVTAVANDDTEHPGVLYSYDRLPTYVKKAIAPLVGDGKQQLYDYYFKPYEGGFFNDGEASVELVPRKIITQNRNGAASDGSSDDEGLNDIPE